MDHSHFISFFNSGAINIGLTDSDIADISLYLLSLNGRAIMLLLGCFLILYFIKSSAATKHFLVTVSVVSIAVLPLGSRLMPPVDIKINTTYFETADMETMVVNETSLTESNRKIIFSPILFYLVFLGVYFLGLIAILTRVILNNIKLFLLIRLCNPVVQKNWLDSMEKNRVKLGIRRRIELRHSNLNISPSTWGAFRPVILLPSAALQWPGHLIESTVLHELAHIKRYDWLIQQIACCIYAFYWLNPLCRVAVNKLFIHAETACDDLAINTGVSNIHYAENLVNVAEQALQHKSHKLAVLAMATNDKHSQLSDRILAILNQYECRSPLTSEQALSTLVVFVCLMIPLTSIKARFVEHSDIVIQESTNPAIMKKNDVFLGHNSYDYIEAIPVDIAPKEEVIEKPKTGTNGEKLTQLKKMLQTFNTPPEENVPDSKDIDIPNFSTKGTFSKTQDTNRSPSIGTDAVIKKHSIKPLTDTPKEIVSQLPSPGNTVPEASKNISSHSPVNMVIPDYPYRALSRGIEGEVTVEYSIDEHGKVVEAEVLSAYPAGIFNRNVLKAIKNSTFNPRKVDGKPVPATGLIEKYLFVLKT